MNVGIAMQCNAMQKNAARWCVCGGEDPSTKQSSIETNTYRYERPKKGFMHTPQLGPSVVTVPLLLPQSTGVCVYAALRGVFLTTRRRHVQRSPVRRERTFYGPS